MNSNPVPPPLHRPSAPTPAAVPGLHEVPPNIVPYNRSTNPFKGPNNALEIAQRNAEGSFHTEREATVQSWILADRLQRSRWLYPSGHLAGHLPEWIRYFQTQYEPELAPSSQTLIIDNNPTVGKPICLRTRLATGSST